MNLSLELQNATDAEIHESTPDIQAVQGEYLHLLKFFVRVRKRNAAIAVLADQEPLVLSYAGRSDPGIDAIKLMASIPGLPGEEAQFRISSTCNSSGVDRGAIAIR